MAQEFESPGSEYHQPKQRREADELRAPAPETAAPAGELGIDRKATESARERKGKQKEKQQKYHKLLKKMVYAAASAVAVVGLSQSVGTQTQSAAGSTLAVMISTDGIFLYFEYEDGSEGGVTSYSTQTVYYSYSDDYEISEYTGKAMSSHEGYDFEHESTSFPMSALESRDGISFDEETYTLTLQNYSNTFLGVSIYDAGGEDTLTIQLEGTNQLGHMRIFGVENVIFSGTGSLEMTGVSEVYNVTMGMYEEAHPYGGIYIFDQTVEGEEDSCTKKIFVGDECSLTADALSVQSYVPISDVSVTGNLQWEHTSESEANGYYCCFFYDIAPLNDTSLDGSDTITDDGTAETKETDSFEVTEESGTASVGTTAVTATESYLIASFYNRPNLEDLVAIRQRIVSFTFLDTLEGMPADAWDVSNDESGTIMAWVNVADEAGTDQETMYDLYIAADGKVKANPDCSGLFLNYGSLKTINFNGNFDTSDVIYMNYMFEGCTYLTSLDLSSFNTSNVTNMCTMFDNCDNLTNLDLGSFDTSNVTNMSGMFQYCDSLVNLNLSSFNTSSVTDMRCMFNECKSLINLDLSSFDTSNVTDMDRMFYMCTSLTSLDLSGFDTSNVTDMSYMFYYCNSLTSLDLNGFDTSNVTDMSYMFYYCSSLASLNVSSFNTSNVTDMKYMFENCSSLTTLDLSSFNTSKVVFMFRMFYGCSNLTDLDISNFDMSAIAEGGAERMFTGTPLADQY